jgi:hypothetical protein
VSRRRRYRADTPVKEAVEELIEEFGARQALEAVADYCEQILRLRCFVPGLRDAAESLNQEIER